LRNSPDVLAWNTDKTYLRELAAAGVPVVPTTFLGPDDEVRLPAGNGGFVVEPSVSTGSRNTARYTADEVTAAQDHAQRLLNAGRVEPSMFFTFAPAQAVSGFAAAVTAAAGKPVP
jgi:hypothetical protein